ncbi:MAG: MMPL family transporter, partial [candidate division Zixibacteria bacterium]|nr:MMPL family transporter [candidate division Zixibacteria bacterium]
MMIAVLNQQVLKRPILWIAFSVSACAILASGLAKLNIRTDGEAIYPENNLVVSNTIADRETFDDPEQVILLITTSENGPLVSSREGLEFIKMAHEEIAAIEGVSSAHILSIASLTELTDDGHTIRIGEYLDLIPADSSGAHDLVLRLRKHPLTSGLLLSTDGTCAVIYAPMKKGENRLSFIEKMRSFIKGNTSKDFEIYLTGPLIAEATLGEMVLRDLLWLVPIMVSLIAILLLLTLRTPGGVMIP